MSSVPIMDLAAALERLDGDRDLFTRLAEMFIGRCGEDLSAIHMAMQTENAPELADHAHKIKGSAMEFYAHPAVAAAKALEEAAQASDMAHAKTLCRTLESELARLVAELTRILKRGCSS
jgi:HPt (histidine-containing phosphotransfer) domain-containing protein